MSVSNEKVAVGGGKEMGKERVCVVGVWGCGGEGARGVCVWGGGGGMGFLTHLVCSVVEGHAILQRERTHGIDGPARSGGVARELGERIRHENGGKQDMGERREKATDRGGELDPFVCARGSVYGGGGGGGGGR